VLTHTSTYTSTYTHHDKVIAAAGFIKIESHDV